MARAESVRRTFFVTLTLAVVCSFLVSVSAVGLRERQEANRLRDRKRNILVVTGLYDANVPIDQAFARIETKVVDLETGEYADIDPAEFDQAGAAHDPATSTTPSPDIAGINRRERYSLVYLVKADGVLEQVVLPVRGRGLWSTMYAFLALDKDLETVRGITYYRHGETPGLGGEIDNPRWQASWKGKKVFGKDGRVALRVVKGAAASDLEVDGLSGATLTCDGVTATIRYWLSESGFKPYLERLRKNHG